MARRLTMACTHTPRVQPLKDGAVKPQNIDPDIITLGAGQLFFRNLQYDDFDVSEMSISGTRLAKERGTRSKWDGSARPEDLNVSAMF